MLLADKRSEFGRRIEARPDLGLRRRFCDSGGEVVEDGSFDEQPCSGDAALAVVEHPRCDRTGDGLLEVGVGEDDVGALAAELERDLLEVALRRLDDLLAHLGGTGEGDLVDVVVRGECGACVAEAGDDVDDAGREARFGEHFAEQQSRQRGLLGRLENHGVARREGRGQLERRHQEREIPRDDQAADTDGLTQRVGVELATRDERHRDVDGAAGDLGGQTGVVAEDVSRPCGVDGGRDGGGLAVVEGFELTELLGALVEDVADAPEQTLALVGLHARPRAVVECLARGADGAVDVGGVAAGDRCQRASVGGIDGFEGLTGCGGDPLTSDQHRSIGRDEIPDLGCQFGCYSGHASSCSSVQIVICVIDADLSIVLPLLAWDEVSRN